MDVAEAALESARGKMKMAILGHPLYAGGRYLGESDPDFAALHRLLQEHDVAIVMAGDTHDLEYYTERRAGPPKVMHHFVNGGGGAYLSFGTAWTGRIGRRLPSGRSTRTQRRSSAKIEATTPRWKWPAWWWTKRLGGWPFSAEWLSAAFDANVAPFYQSFVEVRVEPTKGRVHLLPYGVHGRLHWSDMEVSAGASPPMPCPTRRWSGSWRCPGRDEHGRWPSSGRTSSDSAGPEFRGGEILTTNLTVSGSGDL